MIPDYYKRLGLTKSATKIEIKKAYRKLALEYHPDRNKSPDAHQKFIEINEAYLILNDEEARIKYNLEYDHYFDKKSTQENSQYNKQQWENFNEEFKYSNQKTTFSDEDLNNWAKNAREQGQDFAKMAFSEFSKQVIGFVEETGFQLGNALIVFFGLILTMGGCGNLIIGIATKGDIGSPIAGLVMLPIGILLYRFASKNWKNKE